MSFLLLVYGRHFDFRHTRTSDSIPTSLNVLPDPGNMGLAVGIALLSCIRAEIYVISYLLRLMAAIFDFRHAQTLDSIPTSLLMLPDPEKMGTDVGILLLSWLKAQIYIISHLLPVLSRHIGYLVRATLIRTPPSCSPAIFRQVAKAFSLTSSGYEMAAKTVAWG